MWFISFILGVATSISIFVYGWSSYLEHTKAAAAEARQREWLASMPMPPPRPPGPEARPEARPAREEVEVVRVPTPAKVTYNAWQNGRYNRNRYVKPRYAKPRYAKPRHGRARETW